MARLALAWRLAGGFAVVGTLVLAGTSLYLDSALRADAGAHADAEADAKLIAIRRTLAAIDSPRDVRASTPKFEAIFFGHPEQVALLTEPSGRLLVAIPASASTLAVGWEEARAERERTIGGRPYRWTTALLSTRGGGEVRALLGQDMSASQAIFDAHLRRVGESLIVGTLLLALAAWITTRRGLAPLHAMAKNIAALDATRLSSRLDTRPLPRDLVPFANSINVALTRLEEAFARLSRFAADLAHDLRTPIANLRGEAEVALSRNRTSAEYQDVLASSIEEYERLTNMIEAMLFIARADRAELAVQPQMLDLAEQTRQLVDFLEPLAAARQLTLRVTGNGEVRADRMMIRRALSNLLSNAIHHATAATEIVVILRMNGAFAEIAVENLGDPIPEDVRSRVFDRFFRGDNARTDSATRTGLGLAIVRAIAKLHRGEVILEATPPGTTRFVLRLPTVTGLDAA